MSEQTLSHENEIWKPVAGWELCYEVSNYGNIRSISRVVDNRQGKNRQKIISKSLGRDGYLRVHLHFRKIKKTIRVHKIVANSFIRIASEKEDINHKDGNRLNNNISNLEIVSRRENITHGKRAKKICTGASFHKSNNKWLSRITVDGKRKILGYFETEQEAHEAYMKALGLYNLQNKYAKIPQPPKDAP